MGIIGGAKLKLGNIYVPINFMKKSYRDKVIEHNSAYLFCLIILVGPTANMKHFMLIHALYYYKK